MIYMLPLIVVMAADVQAKPPEQIYKEALPSVLTLLVEKKDGSSVQGSAFLAMDHCLAVTIWHVAQGASRDVAKFAGRPQVNPWSASTPRWTSGAEDSQYAICPGRRKRDRNLTL